MIKFITKAKNRLISVVGICLVLVVAGTTWGESVPEVSYSNGRITVKAVDAPLVPLLRSIAEVATIDIFVSKSVELSKVTISIRQEPLEPAMRRLLDRFNHMMMYSQKDGKAVLCSINVLSHGESGVPLMAVNEAGKQSATAKRSGSPPAGIEREPQIAPEPPSPEAVAVGSRGLFVPGSYGSERKQGMSAMTAKDSEIQEHRAFFEIVALKKEIKESRDPDEQAALNVVLMEKLNEFESFQRTNRSRMESLHRIELFNQMKRNLTFK